MTITNTTTPGLMTPDKAAEEIWDVVVVGAGPAGSIVARELARRDCRVLLVDKKNFPRPKVCGACLSRRALDALTSVGLGHVARDLGGRPYDRFQLCSRGAAANVRLPAGLAVSRDALDARLVQEAVNQSAVFLPGTTATLGEPADDRWRIRLSRSNGESCNDDFVEARAVVAADGVGGRLSAKLPNAECRIWESSRIGAAATIPGQPSDYDRSAIYMGVAQNGYVGLVRIENNALHVAAALDRQFVRRYGTLGRAARRVLMESGLPRVERIEDATWRGTAQLTRRPRQVGFHRLFAIGDAAGYAEPFTGEGMTWAITSAIMVVPYVLQAVRDWSPQIAARWSAAHRRTIRSRQNDCFRLATWLRYPRLVHATVVALSCFPWLADPIVRRINRAAQEIMP